MARRVTFRTLEMAAGEAEAARPVERLVPHCRSCGTIPAEFGVGKPGWDHLYADPEFHLCGDCWSDQRAADHPKEQAA